MTFICIAFARLVYKVHSTFKDEVRKYLVNVFLGVFFLSTETNTHLNELTQQKQKNPFIMYTNACSLDLNQRHRSRLTSFIG